MSDQDNDVLGDSQGSGDDMSDFEIPQWKYDAKEDDDLVLSSSSSDDESDAPDDNGSNEEYCDDMGPHTTSYGSGLDQILSRVKKSSRITRASRTASLPVISKKNKGDLAITSFNLGASFDSKVTDKVEQLKSVRQMMEIGLSQPESNGVVMREETIRGLKTRYRIKLEKNDMLESVDPDLIDVMCRDETGRYRDWYFITKNSKDETIPTRNILGFFTSLGVNPKILEDEFHVVDSHLDELDPYPMVHHPAYILQEFEKLPIHTNTFKWWLFLILDKTIFNSLECNVFWCETMIHKFTIQYGSLKKLVELYWEYIQLKERKYYMLYRLTRLVPSLKSAFMDDLFEKDSKKLVKQFDVLFDSQNYKDLLYFILFIYGSELYPIGNDSNLEGETDEAKEIMNFDGEFDTLSGQSTVNPIPLQSMSQYFKDCIIDVSSDGQCAREIPIMLGILKLFSFQT